jgi:tetratricopeptide (TPR) repeat protein
MNSVLNRDTCGQAVLADLDASIECLAHRSPEGRRNDLVTLSEQLFLRGEVLGRIADHDRTEAIAGRAAALFPEDVGAMVVRARLATRFHRFAEAHALLDRARVIGASNREKIRQVISAKAAVLQATGAFWEALEMHDALAREARSLETLGALATLSAASGQWTMAELLYAEALDAHNDATSPFARAKVLFEWGVGAMRQGTLDVAEARFAQLETFLPGHVPGRAHRAEVALARWHVDDAEILIRPVLAVSDDPRYVAINAKILVARGDRVAAAIEAQRAALAYSSLLARRPDAHAGQAADFFMSVGGDPLRAVELAAYHRALRDTPRSRALLAKAQQVAKARRTRHPSGWILAPVRCLS